MSNDYLIIIEKLDQIQQDINLIKQDLEQLKHSINKMDNHVDFINDVYSTVEQPLTFLSNKWKSLSTISGLIE